MAPTVIDLNTGEGREKIELPGNISAELAKTFIVDGSKPEEFKGVALLLESIEKYAFVWVGENHELFAQMHSADKGAFFPLFEGGRFALSLAETKDSPIAFLTLLQSFKIIVEAPSQPEAQPQPEPEAETAKPAEEAAQ